jgi:hypothetical protein
VPCLVVGKRVLVAAITVPPARAARPAIHDLHFWRQVMDTPTTTQSAVHADDHPVGDPVVAGPGTSGTDPVMGPEAARPTTDDDAAQWREAALLRQKHPAWVIIWLSRVGQYRAYRRFPGARRGTTLMAATPGDLAAQIVKAEQAFSASRPTRPRRD